MKHGSTWCGVCAGSLSLPFFPSEAVFAVVRDGHRIGFRSIG
jgi:hypothetical protein